MAIPQCSREGGAQWLKFMATTIFELLYDVKFVRNNILMFVLIIIMFLPYIFGSLI